MVADEIAKDHNIRLCGMVFSNSQYERGLADAQFAVSMTWVRKYVKEKQMNISCPIDVLTGLNYKGGVKKMTVKLFSMNRNSKGMTQIKNTARMKMI